MKFAGQIECISILRVVGALGIAVYHIGTFNDHIDTLQAGVSFFFCISAFLMMYTTQKGVFSHYILKRLIRIVPLYWIMTAFIRVVGALGIALYHIGTFNDHIATLQAGVSLFFCISAFLMMYTTQKGVSSHYILKRLIRIVPLYWIMTAFTFAAMQVVPSISTGGTPEFIKSLFFIPYVRHAYSSYRMFATP